MFLPHLANAKIAGLCGFDRVQVPAVVAGLRTAGDFQRECGACFDKGHVIALPGDEEAGLVHGIADFNLFKAAILAHGITTHAYVILRTVVSVSEGGKAHMQQVHLFKIGFHVGQLPQLGPAVNVFHILAFADSVSMEISDADIAVDGIEARELKAHFQVAGETFSSPEDAVIRMVACFRAGFEFHAFRTVSDRAVRAIERPMPAPVLTAGVL